MDFADMGRIHILPISVVNKIAAGEVIERPAAVVKELIENALDSGARRIDIRLEEGGRRSIVVSDDGEGIFPEDLPVAVAPHATSKLKTADDLFAVMTLGFRGEALASLAEVSRLRIVSCSRGATEAASLRVEGGKAGEVEPAARAPGTTIEVEHLFFNTPARRKFLKNPAIEYGHCLDVVTRFAIAWPHIAFECRHDAQPPLVLPATKDLRERFGHFYGREFAEALLEASGTEGGIRCRVFCAPPAFARPTSRQQFFFLNGRHIRDRVLGKALSEAYRGLLMLHQYPVATAFVEMPASEVDVNVHPTKIEVRFRNVWAVHDCLLKAVRARLLEARLAPSFPVGGTGGLRPSASPAAGAAAQSDPAQDRPEAVRQAMADFFAAHARGESPPVPHPSWAAPGRAGEGAPDTSGAAPPAVPSELPGTSPRRFAQFHHAYILQETDQGLDIIDQHALHERVLLFEIEERLRSRSIARQRLLIPITVELSAREFAVFPAIRAALETVGVEAEPFGRSTVAVTAVPAMASKADFAALLREMCTAVDDRNPGSAEADGLIDRCAHLMACKAAVRAGDPLTTDEIAHLLRRRSEVEHTETCAHGRPTTLHLSLGDLERHFRRK